MVQTNVRQAGKTRTREGAVAKRDHTVPIIPHPFEDTYRERIKWTKWTWGSHCVDCYPSNCPFRVYVGPDGEVWREEQAGTYGTVEEGVPDFNPAGCQKGVTWHRLLTGRERVLKPLKRAGERGEG